MIKRKMANKFMSTFLVIAVFASVSDAFLLKYSTKVGFRSRSLGMCENKDKPVDGMMQRPVLDNVVTKSIYSLEMLRVKMMAEKPNEENGGWNGEPRAWANDDSLAQKVSSSVHRRSEL